MKGIIKFLHGAPLSFDFTDDCTASTEYQAKKGYEKYFIYRSPKPDGKGRSPIAVSVIENNYQSYGYIGDPDVESKLLQSIYSLLWPEIKERKSEYLVNRGGWIYSDTLISVQTTLNNYIRKEMPEVLKKEGVKRISNNICIQLYGTDPLFRKLLNKNEDLSHFIAIYHTLGNYLPVCCGFNIARSGYYGSHDYWDLTLMKIKEYYDATKAAQSGFGDFLTSPELKLLQLLHCNSEVVSCCQWLNSFERWENFIEQNLLQDFVDTDNQPIPLCKGHSWECPQVLDFNDFFKNGWQIVEKRGVRMIKMLEKRVLESV